MDQIQYLCNSTTDIFLIHKLKLSFRHPMSYCKRWFGTEWISHERSLTCMIKVYIIVAKSNEDQ